MRCFCAAQCEGPATPALLQKHASCNTVCAYIVEFLQPRSICFLLADACFRSLVFNFLLCFTF